MTHHAAAPRRPRARRGTIGAADQGRQERRVLAGRCGNTTGASAHNLYAPFYKAYIPAANRSGTSGVAGAFGEQLPGLRQRRGARHLRLLGYPPSGGLRNGDNNCNEPARAGRTRAPTGISGVTLYTDEHGEAWAMYDPNLSPYVGGFRSLPDGGRHEQLQVRSLAGCGGRRDDHGDGLLSGAARNRRPPCRQARCTRPSTRWRSRRSRAPSRRRASRHHLHRDDHRPRTATRLSAPRSGSHVVSEVRRRSPRDPAVARATGSATTGHDRRSDAHDGHQRSGRRRTSVELVQPVPRHHEREPRNAVAATA